MAKKILVFSLMIALISSGLWLKTKRDAQPDHPKKEYDEWFAQQLDELRKTYVRSQEDRFNNPDMFFMWDRLKRTNPVTGVYPEDGLQKAWALVQRMESERSGTNYAVTWEERGPNNIGGRTRAFMWDPNDANKEAAFAGGVGGSLYRTSDVTSINTNWQLVNQMFSNVAVTCLAYDPTNTQIMYFGTGEGWLNSDAQRGAGIWKSTNGGNTWDQIPSTNNSTFYFNQKIVVNAQGHVFAATKGGLHKSTNQGTSWTKVLGNGTGQGNDWITDLEIAADDDLYAAVNGSGIFHAASTQGATQGDQGNWTKLNTGFAANVERIEIACAPSDANYVYAITEVSGAVDQVYRTTNGGSSWAATPSEPGGNDMSNGQAWYDLSLGVSPTNRNYVYAGGVPLYRTVNGGSSWTQVNGSGTKAMHVDQHGVFFRPGSQSDVVFTNDGGVYYTTNSFQTVEARNDDYNVTQFYSISVDPRPGNPGILGGTQDNGSMILTQNGVSGAFDVSGGDGSYCAINHQDPDTLFTTFQFQSIRRSKNGGITTQSLTNPNLSQGDVLFINPLEMDPNNPHQLYQAATELWRHNNASSGGGGGWTKATTVLSSSGITAIGISKSTANLVYIGAGGTVYRLPNANQGNFTTNPTPVNPQGMPGGYISCIEVNPSDGNHIVVTYSSYGLTSQVIECRNADQGANATWTSLQGNLPDLPCNWAVFEPNNNKGLLVATDLGVFRCGDITVPVTDIYWSPQRIGMGYPRVEMLEVRTSDNTVHCATHGRGFFSTSSYSLAPDADFGVVSTSACGGKVWFIDSTANAPTSWTWNFGDGNSSNLQSPVHTYQAGGTYNVQLSVSNGNGSDNATKTFQITVLPPIVANAGIDTTGCKGDSIQLQATGGSTYSWTPTDQLDNANIANPVAAVDGDRTYIVTVTDSNGCTDKDTVVVLQQNGPNTWAGQDKQITMLGDSVQLTGFGGVTFQWIPSAGLDCDTCQNPMASPDTSTTYTLISCTAAGCCNSDEVTVQVLVVTRNSFVGTPELFLNAPFPNPVHSSQFFNVEFGIPQRGEINMELLDLNGALVRTIREGNIESGTYRLNISAADLSSGIYFVRMRFGKQTNVRKLLVL